MKRSRKAAVSLFCGLALVIPLAATEPPAVKAEHATAYLCNRTQGDVTIGVEPHVWGGKQVAAFGKADLYRYGFLPILLVVTNHSDAVLPLGRLRVQFVDHQGRAIEATPGEQVRAYQPRGRRDRQSPISTVWWPRIGARAQGPLDDWRVTAREFQSSFVSPRATASGFLYFWTEGDADPARGAKIYVTGLVDALSGKDLMFFDIDLTPCADARDSGANSADSEP